MRSKFWSMVYLNGETEYRWRRVRRNVVPWDYWCVQDGKRRHLQRQPDGSYRERNAGWRYQHGDVL